MAIDGPRRPFSQAVVLCGYGNRLAPLTDDEARLPKALLPVAGEPVLKRSLDWLLADGSVDEAVLVVRRASERPMRDFAASYKPPTSNAKAALKFVVASGPGDAGDEHDTSSSLHALEAALPAITADPFAVVSCDLVTDVPFAELVGAARDAASRNGGTLPALTALFYEGAKVEKGGASAERGNDKDPEADQLVLAPSSPGSPADLLMLLPHNPDRESLVLQPSLLSRHPRVRVSPAYRDAHAYLLRRWAANWMVSRAADWHSLREEAIPALVKAAWKGPEWREKNGLDKAIVAGDFGIMPVHVRAHLLPATSERYCLRANRAWSLLEANRRFLDAAPPGPKETGKPIVLVRRSAVGTGASLGLDAKIVNSVLGKDVAVGEKSKLEGCIVADGAKIGINCSLTSCDVGPGAVVDDGTTAKGETFSAEDDEEDDDE
ncbi:hypothetical protein DFJ74DRAFT_655072 [Hyaloraphidium curvatum]|nr:hypothetical protein DFJ74DRAFT_655072 [Hyaloraphidium curvatum]